MKCIGYLAQSLDGYIAGPNDELDWLGQIDNPEQSDFGFADFMAGVDALLMGRRTFEVVAGIGLWPYSKPVFVASNSLAEVPATLQGKATIVRGDLEAMTAELVAQGHRSIYIDGGKLIQSALANNLLDELILTTVPILLGRGVSLFGQLDDSRKLSLLSSEVLLGQLVKSHYQLTAR